jgi:hypothetical protein
MAIAPDNLDYCRRENRSVNDVVAATTFVIGPTDLRGPDTVPSHDCPLARGTPLASSTRVHRRLFGVVAVLLMSACTEVNDFGAYWDKGIVDPTVAGQWKKLGVPGQPITSTPGADLLIFTNNGTSYSLRAENPMTANLGADERAQRAQDNAVTHIVRTLRIKNKNFFMVRLGGSTTHGMIDRYEIAGNILREYWFYPAEAEEFLKAKHPTAVNFKRHTDMGYFVSIETFDDEVESICLKPWMTPRSGS